MKPTHKKAPLISHRNVAHIHLSCRLHSFDLSIENTNSAENFTLCVVTEEDICQSKSHLAIASLKSTVGGKTNIRIVRDSKESVGESAEFSPEITLKKLI